MTYDEILDAWKRECPEAAQYEYLQLAFGTPPWEKRDTLLLMGGRKWPPTPEAPYLMSWKTIAKRRAYSISLETENSDTKTS